VNEVTIKLGTYVDARDKMIEITDNNALHADFLIYEKDVHLIKKGQKIHFTVSNRPGEELVAFVHAIGKEFETNTRAVHIHADINEKPLGLIPGMYISGHLHTDTKYARTLPNDAIVTEGTKSFIFIKDDSALEETLELSESENLEDITKDQKQGKVNNTIAFRLVEVITGQKDEDYTEIHLIDSLPDHTQIVMNAAYYLLADMNKEETGDHD
jgi:cobalt-zinc-cadmium efflux system membrane fusion protein